MTALSRLLTKVSKRVLTNNPSNEDMLNTLDRVVLWNNAGYISEEQVEEIIQVVPDVDTADEVVEEVADEVNTENTEE